MLSNLTLLASTRYLARLVLYVVGPLTEQIIRPDLQVGPMPKSQKEADKAVMDLSKKMCGYTPATLHHIKLHNPELAVMINEMDKVMVEDRALDRKTKRLIALACVATRMCEDCVYPQAKVAKNYGATKDEITEAMQVAVICGGVPTWSVAKKGLSKLFEEWDNEPEGEKCPAPKARRKKK
jgi:4-carboxymuconolactone decarboxylase